MHDDAALLKAAGAQWALTPVSHHGRSGTEPTTERAVMICDDDDVTIGCNDECCVILSGTDSMVGLFVCGSVTTLLLHMFIMLCVCYRASARMLCVCFVYVRATSCT